MSKRAKSAAAQYRIAVVDQNVNEVRVFDRNSKAWDDDAIAWSFKGVDHWLNHGWADLSDARIRKSEGRGLIALITASGGNIGIVDVKQEAEKTNSDEDLVWSAEPEGNPHAIERIPATAPSSPPAPRAFCTCIRRATPMTSTTSHGTRRTIHGSFPARMEFCGIPGRDRRRKMVSFGSWVTANSSATGSRAKEWTPISTGGARSRFTMPGTRWGTTCSPTTRTKAVCF